jgi:hypothetical protein
VKHANAVFGASDLTTYVRRLVTKMTKPSLGALWAEFCRFCHHFYASRDRRRVWQRFTVDSVGKLEQPMSRE